MAYQRGDPSRRLIAAGDARKIGEALLLEECYRATPLVTVDRLVHRCTDGDPIYGYVSDTTVRWSMHTGPGPVMPHLNICPSCGAELPKHSEGGSA
jgi:hypothetical protein